MKKRYLAVGLICAAVYGCEVMSPTYHVMQKVTIEVDTPQGVRVGSSVQRVSWTDHTTFLSMGRWNTSLMGEAVVVPLDDGRLIFGLLAEFMLPHRLNHGPNADTQLSKMRYGKRFVLEGKDIPAIVIFTDINDPATAKLLSPVGDEFQKILGEGYAYRQAIVERMAEGYRPFNWLQGGSPEWLFGTPVTRGIEARLPLLVTHRGELWNRGVTSESGLKMNTFSFVRSGI